MGKKRGPYSHRGALACIICFYMWYGWNKEMFLGARGDDCWQVCFTEKDILFTLLSITMRIWIMENTSQSSDMLADWKNLKNCRRRSIKHLSNVATEIEKKIQERKFIIKLFEVDIDKISSIYTTGHDKKLLSDGDNEDEPNCEWLCSHAQADRET